MQAGDLPPLITQRIALRNKCCVLEPGMPTAFTFPISPAFHSIHEKCAQVSATALTGNKFPTSSVAHLETEAYVIDAEKSSYM